ENLATLLQVVNRIGRRHPSSVGRERTSRSRGNRAMPRLPPAEDVIHDPGPFRIGQELRPEADETARRNPKFETDTAASVVHHLCRNAAPCPRLRDDDSLKFLGYVDDEIFDGLHLHAVVSPGHVLRTRYLQFVPLPPHHLDENRQLQFAATDDLHLL